MSEAYIEQRDGGYYISATRVSLDSVVCAFLRGESAEGIVESFPSLTLEQAYGAITYYLAHREQIDAHLQRAKSDFDRMRAESRRHNPSLYAKLDAAQASTSNRRP